ncbi:hypothetical protein ACSEQ4_12080 [Pseudomonas aeruginosa]
MNYENSPEDDGSPVSPGELKTAIERVLAERLPGLRTLGFDLDLREALELPALLLEVSEFEPGSVDPGTGESRISLHIEARIVVAPEAEDFQGLALHLATQLAHMLRGQTWGVEVEPAAFVEAGRDWTRPEFDSYHVWLVQWRQEILLGREEWPWSDETGQRLLIGIDPETGPGHEGCYVPAEELSG